MRLLAPQPLDVAAPALAFSPGGSGAIAFGLEDLDRPSAGQAQAALLGADGRVARAQRLTRQRQVLDLGFFGGVLDVLTGAGTGDKACCATVDLVSHGPHGWGRSRTVVRGLTGTTLGRLLPAGKGVLAAIGSADAVFVAQGPATAHLTGRRLTPAAAEPDSLVATALRGGHTLLAFATMSRQPADNAAPQSIMVAGGTASSAPREVSDAVTLPAGHTATELALVPGTSAATLGWIEDYFGSDGSYQSQVELGDLTGTVRSRAFAQAGGVDSDLVAAADRAGDQVIAWKTCDAVPVCHVVAVSRQARHHFAAPVTLGAIDAEAEPAVTMTAGASAVAGWVLGGHVDVARRSGATGGFSRPAQLPGDGHAGGLTLAFAPGGRVLAAWSDGSPRAAVLVCTYTP